MENDLKEKQDLYIRAISYILLTIGLLLSLFLLYKIVFLGCRQLCDLEIKLAVLFIAGGLGGSVFSFVLKKIITDNIVKYCEEEITNTIKSELAKTAKKIINRIPEEVEEAIILNKALNEEEIIQTSNDEILNNTDLNTVIVPVTDTSESVKLNKQYICPENYVFKNGLDYIAFYLNKRVIGYGKITSNYQENNSGVRIFAFDAFINLDIPHERKGAFVQGKMYCNIEMLKKAKNTMEIRPK